MVIALLVVLIMGMFLYFKVLKPSPAVNQANTVVNPPPPPPVATLGKLSVTANVDGAKITVDGRSDPTWVTPHIISDLTPGTHDVVVSKDGYNNFEQNVTVAAGQTSNLEGSISLPAVTPPSPPPPTVSRPAAAKVGQLMVSANVNGARISVDGRSDPSWVTPATIPDLSAGAHNVEISMDGYDNFRQSVMIEGGKTASVTGTLSAPMSELDILTIPSGVEVTIDGKSYGTTPTHATLPPGRHDYTVKQPGGTPFQSSIVLKSGQIITKKLTLGQAPNTGIVEVRSIPPGATVLADGAPQGGQTPTSFRLPVGTHTLVISLSGYPPVRRQITVSADGTTPLNVNLTSQ